MFDNKFDFNVYTNTLFLYVYLFYWNNVECAVFGQECKTKVTAFKSGYCLCAKTEVSMNMCHCEEETVLHRWKY